MKYKYLTLKSGLPIADHYLNEIREKDGFDLFFIVSFGNEMFHFFRKEVEEGESVWDESMPSMAEMKQDAQSPGGGSRDSRR